MIDTSNANGATTPTMPRSRRHAEAARANGIEPIRAGEIYLLSDFARRAGLKAKALRTARRRGLKIVYFATRAYIRGEWWGEFLEKVAAEDVGS